MNDTIKLARLRFDQGFSCSQAILAAFAPEIGLDEDIAYKIAAPFGGGISRQGETCGAVTGSLIILGIKYGPLPGENNEKLYEISQEFLLRFMTMNLSVKCRQLINFDLSWMDELQAAREANVFKRICPRLVENAAEILQSMFSSMG
jgi:C_GCAxxG_C_C family probable redox protein